jgi:hypothetical protein
MSPINKLTSFDMNLAHIHPGDREGVRSSLEKALKGKDDHWQLEYRFQCLDGSCRTILDKAYILRPPARAAIRMIGAMHDITGQRNLEKMLVEEEVRKKQEIIKGIMEKAVKKGMGNNATGVISLSLKNIYVPHSILLLRCLLRMVLRLQPGHPAPVRRIPSAAGF